MSSEKTSVDKTKREKIAPAERGLVIRTLARDGVLFASGLRARDRIVSVNGHPIRDELDFYYHAAADFFEMEIERGGRIGSVGVTREPGHGIDVEFYEKPVSRCANRCVFCFIDQMPPNLRRSLYVKDEDVKHSFLNGNYVTMTDIKRDDLERIVSIGLSPLFVSVHATPPKVRAMMLGNKRIPDIREQLRFLSDHGVAFHTQIVLCPGYNDGAVLERTVADLFAYKNSILSIAVVPVGLTKFRKKLSPLKAVDTPAAIDVCEKMNAISTEMMARDGVRKLFVADEFFIKAGLPVPAAKYYEDYPQIENGVGLVRQLLVKSKSLKSKYLYGDGGYIRVNSAPLGRTTPPKTEYAKTRILKPCYGGLCGNNYYIQSTATSKDVLVVTGCSAYPYIKKVFDDIGRLVGDSYDVVAVENYYMGETVTVAGLLTARDVIRKIKQSSKAYAKVILPAVIFNHAGYTLDGYSAKRIEKSIELPVQIVSSIEDIK